MNGFSSVIISNIEETGEGKWAIHFSIPLSSPYYREHFEAFHLLPAVAEIDIAAIEAGRLLTRKLSVSKIKKAKFTRPITPETKMVLALDLAKENSLSFRYSDEDGNSYSSGTLEVHS